jgi:hypothetical protein
VSYSAQHARSADRRTALDHMLRTADYFGQNIFTSYDVPDLPPTNNDHEHVFGRFSRYQRTITGHKSTARRTARDGPFVLPVLERAGNLPTAEDLAAVPAAVRLENLRRITEAMQRFSRPTRLRKNLDNELTDLLMSLRTLKPDTSARARTGKGILRR